MNNEPSPTALELADDLARKIVAGSVPIRFQVAHSPAECEATYRLRYQVVVERGWASPENELNGMERDHYDDQAIHIAGWDGDTLAATARVILPWPGIQLPTELAFEMEIQPQGLVADMGRQIVARDYTSMRHRVFAALLAKTWLELRAHGCTFVCGDFSAGMLRLYRILGFDVTQLGPARKFWGEDRYPILVDVAGSVPRLLERWGTA